MENRIAVLGPGNTYSDVACDVFTSRTGMTLEKTYHRTIEEVVAAVSACGRGVLPFENTLEGYVQRHMDLLLGHGICIEAELRLPIAFDLLSRLPLERVDRLFVQYVAEDQCLAFLRSRPGIAIVRTQNNVETVDRYLSDPFSAAIVPHHLATGIEAVLRFDVTDESSNQTRFLIVRSGEAGFARYVSGAPAKVSLVIEPVEDRPGLLFDILRTFAENRINLISIMSRPTRRQIGTYRFFIDLECDEKDIGFVEGVLRDLRRRFTILVLGIYQDVGARSV
jgi:prephenate dehydratase